MRTPRTCLVVVAVALLAAACVNTRPAKDSLMDVARERAAHEFPACPAARITTTPRFDLTADSVEAEACGEHAVYSCPVSRRKWESDGRLQHVDVRDACFREAASPTAHR